MISLVVFCYSYLVDTKGWGLVLKIIFYIVAIYNGFEAYRFYIMGA